MIHHLHTHPHLLKNVQQKKYRGKRRKGIAAEKNWTREEIETLIMLWEGNEILYNVSLLDILTKIKSWLLLNKSQSNWRQMKKMSAKNWIV